MNESTDTSVVGQSHSDTENPLGFIRNQSQFQQMRYIIQQNPQLLNEILQDIEQTNPALLQLFFQNQNSFVSMLHEPVSSSESATTPPIDNNVIITKGILPEVGGSSDGHGVEMAVENNMESLVMNYSEDEEDFLPENELNKEVTNDCILDENIFNEAVNDEIPIPDAPDILGQFGEIPIVRSNLVLNAPDCIDCKKNYADDGSDVIVMSDEDPLMSKDGADDSISSIIISRVESVAENPNQVVCSFNDPTTTGTLSAKRSKSSLIEKPLSHSVTRDKKSSVSVSSISLAKENENNLTVSFMGSKKALDDSIEIDKKLLSTDKENNISILPKCNKELFDDRNEFDENTSSHIRSEEFIKSTGLEMNKTKKISEIKVFKCTLCPYSSRIRFGLKRHLLTHSLHFPKSISSKMEYESDSDKSAREVESGSKSKVLYNCQYCSYTTSSKRYINVHKKYHTAKNRPIYRCTNCDFKSFKAAIRKHFRSAHSIDLKQYKSSSLLTKNTNEMSKASIVDVQASERNILESRRTRRKASYAWPYVSDSENEFQSKSKRLYNCKYCSYTTEYKQNINIHNKFHTVDNRPIYRCPKCDYKSFKVGVIRHLYSVHREPQAQTENDDLKQLTDSSSSLIAKNMDETSMQLKKSIVNVQVTERNVHESRRVRTRISYAWAYISDSENEFDLNSERLYRCKYCSYITDHKGNKKMHDKKHTEENLPIYCCSKCDYKSFKHNLQNHFKATHEKEDVNTVTNNSICLTHKQSLKVTVKDTQETSKQSKFYSMDDQQNINRSEYKVVLSSTKSIPNSSACEIEAELNSQTSYNCKYCSYTTDHSGNMRTHYRNHTIRRRPIYNCSKCDYTSFKLGVIKHFNSTHKNNKPNSITTNINLNHESEKVLAKNTNNISNQLKISLKNKTSLDVQPREKNVRRRRCKDVQRSANIISSARAIKSDNARLYRCKYCSYIAKMKQHLKNHVEFHADTQRLIFCCTICDYKSFKMSVIKHFNSTHKNDQTHTVTNKFREITQKSLDMMAENTNNTSKQFKLCYSKNKTGFDNQRNDRRISPSPCKDESAYTSNRNKSVREVELDSNALALYSCKYCSYTTNTKFCMNNHNKFHTIKKRPIYCCTNCDYTSFKVNVGKHFNSTHFYDQTYTVNNNFKPLNSLSSMAKNTHKTLKKLKKYNLRDETGSDNQPSERKKKILKTCIYCSHSSTNDGAFKKHLREHMLKQSIYSCNYCSYKSIKRNLSKHCANVHGVKHHFKTSNLTASINKSRRFSCSSCSFSTDIRYLFGKHKSLHSENKLQVFNCTQCDFTGFKISFAKHLKKFHGYSDNKYKKPSDAKDKAKTISGPSEDHQLVDDATKSIIHNALNSTVLYVCEICDYSTNSKIALINHKLKH